MLRLCKRSVTRLKLNQWIKALTTFVSEWWVALTISDENNNLEQSALSYSAEKVLFHWIFFFQSFVLVYECHLWIMRYMSIAYCRHWLRQPERRPQQRVSFIGLLCRFSISFFLEPPKLILYTILNVKFLPFV